MRFFAEQVQTPSDIESQFKAYYDYLQSVRDNLSPTAFNFATANWHYDPNDHRCPHDSWVESLSIEEPSSGKRRQYRKLEFKLRILGAYHDGHAEIIYKEVNSYCLSMPATSKPPRTSVGHGDWLVDEVRLSERGLVEHEIRFSQGASWLIECGDLIHKWFPLNAR